MTRDTDERIGDMLEAISRCQAYAENLYDEASDPRMVTDAIQYNILVIGEAASHLPNNMTDLIPQIKWPSIKAMRNILAHEYFDVDVDRVMETVENGLPDLKAALEKYLVEAE